MTSPNKLSVDWNEEDTSLVLIAKYWLSNTASHSAQCYIKTFNRIHAYNFDAPDIIILSRVPGDFAQLKYGYG